MQANRRAFIIDNSQALNTRTTELERQRSEANFIQSIDELCRRDEDLLTLLRISDWQNAIHLKSRRSE